MSPYLILVKPYITVFFFYVINQFGKELVLS